MRGWKAEIWHAGGLGHEKDNGQGGGEVPHVKRGQGHVQVPQVALLSHGEAVHRRRHNSPRLHIHQI